MEKTTKPAKVNGFRRWLKRLVILPFFARVINSIKFGLWTYKYPEMLWADNFKMLSDLLILILKVSIENKPYGCHIGFVHPYTDKQQEIVSIWAGAGIGASPHKRIKELAEENQLLRDQLKAR